MARKRYQQGSLFLRGKRRKQWIGRWLEDIIVGGVTKRVHKSEVLGTLADYPTKRLAQRALQERLTIINSPTYRATPQSTFKEFTAKWQSISLSQYKPSTQSAIRSQLRQSLSFFNEFRLRDIEPLTVQSFIAALDKSPKTKRNLLMTLRMMWSSAKAWGYVSHDPFESIVLPQQQRPAARCFTEDDVQRILAAAPEPYRTFYLLAAETGLRAGELCGLRWEDIHEGFVRVSGSVWHGRAQSAKTGAAIRTVAISPSLLKQLRDLRQRDGGATDVCFVFHSSKGTPWDANLLVKRKLRPLLASLGIDMAGLHAFRHFNATALDRFSTPLKTRESRLGHTDARFTLRQYTHAVTSDDKKVAAEFDKLFDPTLPKSAAVSA